MPYDRERDLDWDLDRDLDLDLETDFFLAGDLESDLDRERLLGEADLDLFLGEADFDLFLGEADFERERDLERDGRPRSFLSPARPRERERDLERERDRLLVGEREDLRLGGSGHVGEKNEMKRR